MGPIEHFRGRLVVMRSFWTVALVVVVHVAVSGCQPSAALGRSGVVLTPPGSWRSVKASTWMTPGLPLAAWSGPGGSSLVVYRALPIPGGSPAAVVVALSNQLENLPGLTLQVKRVESLGHASAARVEVVAPGTGDALAPSGAGTPVAPDGKALIPTRQVTAAFVRSDGTYYVVWHVPDASYSQIEPDIKTILESIQFTSELRSSSYTD
jgi:hypothetical protein